MTDLACLCVTSPRRPRFTRPVWERANKHTRQHDWPAGWGHYLQCTGTHVQCSLTMALLSPSASCPELAVCGNHSAICPLARQEDLIAAPTTHSASTHTHTHLHSVTRKSCVVPHFNDWCGKLLPLQAINPSLTPRGQYLCACGICVCVCACAVMSFDTHTWASRAASEPRGLVNLAVHFLLKAAWTRLECQWG